MIRFHELKSPGKEMIKATTWGRIHNNLSRLVALKAESEGDPRGDKNVSRVQRGEGILSACNFRMEINGDYLFVH